MTQPGEQRPHEQRDEPLGQGWFPVARSEDVGTTPLRVLAGGHAYTAFRPREGAPVAVVAERCPHRLVRLAHGRVVDGALQCPYHGWRFGHDGRCALVPSAGAQAAPPPRADLAVPWGVAERDGRVWVAPAAAGQPVAVDDRATTQTLTNLDPSLEHGWHAVALAEELAAALTGESAGLDVRLLGRTWRLGRADDGTLTADPAPAALAERFGALWLAPRPPQVPLLEAPDDADPQFAAGWLRPDRSSSPAGVLAENFLDVAHFPFVHAGTFGAAEEPYVPGYDVAADDDGLTSVQEQWFDNPEDPGVAAGVRAVRQRRRAGYVYRWPFQLLLRLEELDAGAVKTILFFLQPEDAGCTRVYTKMLLHGIGGVPVPDADVVAREVAFEVAVLAEDLALQQAMTVTGLPLRLRDELHVRSDRSGVALRRILTAHQKG